VAAGDFDIPESIDEALQEHFFLTPVGVFAPQFGSGFFGGVTWRF
jgi:hypothetical protein